MNLDEIRTFVSIAQSGAFTRAANQLHRSQPAISRRISQLEEELGAPLLDRVRGGVCLTEAGRAFMPFAQNIVAAIQDGTDAVQAVSREEIGSLSLAIVGTLADTKLLELLRHFAASSKGVRLALRTATSREVSDLVRSGEATLGLRYLADESPDLVINNVGIEELLVVASAEHPLAGKRNVSSASLQDERWVSFPVSKGHPESFGNILLRQLVIVGLGEAEVMYVDSLTAQKRLVEAGFGLALLPASSVQNELQMGSLKVLKAPTLRTAVPVFVLHRRHGYLSSAARTLLALMTEQSLGANQGNNPSE